MVPPPKVSRWLWPAPALELSLDSWRTALTAHSVRVLVTTAGLTLAVVLGSYWPASPPLSVWMVSAVYPVAVLALLLVRHSPRADAAILLGAFLVITPGLFASFGPSPTPYLCLTTACVLSAVLIGPRASLGFLGSSVALLLVGVAIHLRLHRDHPSSETLALWFRVSLVWFTMTSWLLFVTNWLTDRIDRALRQKGMALAAAEQAGERHLVSEQRREATETALIEAQRHEAIGRIAGGVSHDFNNSLFVILGWNDLLSHGDVSAEQRVQGHDAIAKAGRHAAELARRLVAMGRERPGPPHVIALRALVEDGVRYLARLLPDSVRVSSELVEVPPVAVDPGLMQQVLLNLALEARDAMPDGGRLSFELRVRASSDGQPARWVVISVRDTGHGLDEAARARLQQPWGSGFGNSSGVGLAATRAIVERAGGRLEFESELGRGTVCHVVLPIATPPESAPARADSPPAVRAKPTRRATILVVEDDDAVRELMVVALRGRGHQVREAADGDVAMALLSDGIAHDDLLCIDGVLPGAPATAIIERFRVTRPGLPILVCSGNLGTPQLQALVQDERLPFLPKPFTPEELARKVDELLVGRSLLRPRP
ncbi:MAG: ATP-binding protein [Candidatus Eisenbacteria bacterium]